MTGRAELLANGDVLAGDRRLCKGTPEHTRLLAAVQRGEAKLFRRPGRFGGDSQPPEPTVEGVLERLGVAGEPLERRRQAATDAAYGGLLNVRELRIMRQADMVPYNYVD